jgi:hypothetical protein
VDFRTQLLAVAQKRLDKQILTLIRLIMEMYLFINKILSCFLIKKNICICTGRDFLLWEKISLWCGKRRGTKGLTDMIP